MRVSRLLKFNDRDIKLKELTSITPTMVNYIGHYFFKKKVTKALLLNMTSAPQYRVNSIIFSETVTITMRQSQKKQSKYCL